MARIIRERPFYKNVLKIALPIAGQNLISVGVNMTDTVMLGKLGVVTISACSLANQLSFVFYFILYGLSAGASVLCAQYWGKRDVDSIERILGITMKIAILAGVVVTAVGLLIPEQVISLFNRDPEVVAQGASYLRIISLAFVLNAFTVVFLNVNRSVENVNISLITTLISFGVNVGLNALLIFGLWGFPRLGIVGAAIATAAARLVEFLIAVLYSLRKKNTIHFHFKYFLHGDKVLFWDFMRYSTPVVGNEICWSMAATVRTAVMSNLGTQATAAQNIVDVVSRLANVALIGVADAATIIIGKSVGEGKRERTLDISKSMLTVSVGIGVVSAALMLIFRTFILKIGIFTVDELTATYVMGIMLVQAGTNFVASFNLTNIVGVIRGGGDTRFGFALDVMTMYFFSLPLGALGGYVLHLPVPYVYLLLMFDELAKAVIGFYWYKSGKWIRSLTR